jgi:hypothetical protein
MILGLCNDFSHIGSGKILFREKKRQRDRRERKKRDGWGRRTDRRAEHERERET